MIALNYACLHRRHGQDKTGLSSFVGGVGSSIQYVGDWAVLSCPVCGVNAFADKSCLHRISRLDKTAKTKRIQFGNFLSPTVLICRQFLFTPTRQDSLALSMSAVRTMHYCENRMILASDDLSQHTRDKYRETTDDRQAFNILQHKPHFATFGNKPSISHHLNILLYCFVYRCRPFHVNEDVYMNPFGFRYDIIVIICFSTIDYRVYQSCFSWKVISHSTVLLQISTMCDR